MPAYNAVVLQEETGAKVGAISQEDDMLRMVGKATSKIAPILSSPIRKTKVPKEAFGSLAGL